MADLEKLAQQMRARAIRIEREELAQGISNEQKRRQEINKKKLAQIKELYFEAGRWAGGAKDWKARQAFETVSLREKK